MVAPTPQGDGQWSNVAESLSTFGFGKSKGKPSANINGLSISIPKREESVDPFRRDSIDSNGSSCTASSRRHSGPPSARHRWSSLIEQCIVESPRDEPVKEDSGSTVIAEGNQTGASMTTIPTPSTFWGSMTSRLSKKPEPVPAQVPSRQNSFSSTTEESELGKEDPASALTRRRTLLGLVREQMRAGSLFGLTAGQESMLSIASGEFADIDDIIANETDLERLKSTIQDLHKSYQGKCSALSRALLRIETLRCEVKTERMQQEDAKELIESMRRDIQKLLDENVKRQIEQTKVAKQEKDARVAKQSQSEAEMREKEGNYVKRIADLERALGIAHDEVARLAARSALAGVEVDREPKGLGNDRVRTANSSPQLLPVNGSSPMMRSSSRRQSIYELPGAACAGASSFPKHEVLQATGHKRTGAVDLGSSFSARRHSLRGDALKLNSGHEFQASPLQGRRGSCYDLRLPTSKQNRCLEAAQSSASSRRASIIEHAAISGGSPMIRSPSHLPVAILDEHQDVPQLVRSDSGKSHSSSEASTSSLPPTPDRAQHATTTDETPTAASLTLQQPEIVIVDEGKGCLDLGELAEQLRSGGEDKSALNSPNLSHYYQQNDLCQDVC